MFEDKRLAADVVVALKEIDKQTNKTGFFAKSLEENKGEATSQVMRLKTV